MKKLLSTSSVTAAKSAAGLKFFIIVLLMAMQCTIVLGQKKPVKGALKAVNDDGKPTLYISPAGNVGIGTSGAQQKLAVNGDVGLMGNALYFNEDQGDHSSFIKANYVNEHTQLTDYHLSIGGFNGVNVGNFSSNSGQYFPFLKVGTGRQSGVVDIMTDKRVGDSHPTGLMLYATGNMEKGRGVEFRTTDASEGVGFSKNAMYQTGIGRSLNFMVNGDGNVLFFTRDAERMFINSNGLVGIKNDLNVAGHLSLGGKIYWDWPDRSISQVTGLGGAAYINFSNSNANTGNSDGGFRFSDHGVAAPAMRIRNGFVGIGTDDPQFPLEVRGERKSGTGYAGKEFTRYGVSDVMSGRGFGTCSVFASGDFVTRNAFVGSYNSDFSDIRLKKDIHKSSSQQDLATLRRVEVSDYKMIDTINNNHSYKKVIAQQVQHVYPQAVGVSFNTLPDVFQNAVSVTHQQDSLYLITVANPQHLKAGDKIELKFAELADANVSVTKINSDRSFTVASAIALDQQKGVFVYGHPATDVLTIDYDAISMLNVSATQQLAKTIDEQQKEIAQLKAQNTAIMLENEKLKNDQAATKVTVNDVLARLAKVEALSAAKQAMAQLK
ncbi:tail fiber domain-containing protein [Mucilaginibacter sp.]|jgi:hypothetical protein|uniref:tail fiber domain-containing protein n=1 Tax=Mucilaginibacter sp. TaxID=1882438 RepID=UPI0035650B39